MIEERVEGAVATLRAAVDVLLEADLTMLSTQELTGLLRDLEVQRRRLTAVDHRVLGEVDDRGVAGELGRTGTAELLTTMLRVAPAEARARVMQARSTQPARQPSGELVPAVLPQCAEALVMGEVSAAHVSVVAKAIDALPSVLAYEVGPVAEAMLVEAARHQHPGALAQTAALLLARLDPDGVEPREEDRERRRAFTMSRRADGSARVNGDWTPEVAALWQAVLDSLSVPLPAIDGTERDDRSPQQRRHDAMGEAAARLLRSGTLPSTNGVPVTVLLRTTAEALADERAGVAQASTGEVWPTRRLLQNLGDTALVPIELDHDGAALRCGRSRRLATRAQRLALALRDGGCVFPGCARPAAWCQVHHVTEWEVGGRTDIDNLCLLCRYHHRSFAKGGWRVEMEQGVAQWRPPGFIDPQRRPVRNTVHHLREIDFHRDVDIGRVG